MMFFIGQVLPYVAVIVFILGMAWRVLTWLKAPVPFQITLFPAPGTGLGRITAISRELLLFNSLRRGDASLWFWAWFMHITLAMIIVGHIVGIYYLTHQFTMIGLTETASSRVSAFLGTSSGIGFFVALIVLFYRRTAIPEVKRLSDPADYFDLLLLLAVVVSGMHMRVTSVEVNLPAIREYLGSLIMLRPMPIPYEWIFVSHFFLVSILLLYFPFSKLVHLAGFFVTRAMLVEEAPVYPTRNGVSRDTRVFKGGGRS
jgi:nitrate reductase gamma subunit